MNKYYYFFPLVLASVFTGKNYAVNPASTQYVDTKIQELRTALESQIASISGGGSATTYTVGQQAMGGIVFWVDSTGQHGLIAATADNTAGVRWGRANFNSLSNGDGIYAGIENTTLAVVAQVASDPTDTANSAVLACANYAIQADGVSACASPGTAGASCLADWYLPSQFELNQLYLQRAIVGGFTTDNYWSSTQDTAATPASSAIAQSFLTGIQSGANKQSTITFNSRCIRAF